LEWAAADVRVKRKELARRKVTCGKEIGRHLFERYGRVDSPLAQEKRRDYAERYCTLEFKQS